MLRQGILSLIKCVAAARVNWSPIPAGEAMLFKVLAVRTDGLFSAKLMTPFSLGISKIDRLISIVVEIGKFLDRANLPSKSKQKILTD